MEQRQMQPQQAQPQQRQVQPQQRQMQPQQGQYRQVQKSQGEWEQAIQTALQSELMNHAKALPEGFKKERFILNAMSVVSDHAKDLKNISEQSLVLCLAKGAYLGLDFLNGECYAIPYSGVAKFQTDYKGELKLAKKYSRKRITDIYAKNVRMGDEFEEIIRDGRQSINFRPEPFSDQPIIGTFAVVLYEDGSMIYDTMSVAEIEKTRDIYSKAKNSKAWLSSTGEMYKKTVLRRLLKLVDLEFDVKEQIEAFQDGSDAEFERPKDMRRSPGPSPQMANDQVIDVFADDLTDVQEDW